MNHIEPASSSHPNPFPLQSFTRAHIEFALNYLKEHQKQRLALSKKDFTVLKNCQELSPLFQEVFKPTPKTQRLSGVKTSNIKNRIFAALRDDHSVRFKR